MRADAQLASRLVQQIDSAQLTSPYFYWQITNYKYSGGRGKKLINPVTNLPDTRFDTCTVLTQGIVAYYSAEAQLFNAQDLPVSYRRAPNSSSPTTNMGPVLDSFVYDVDGNLTTVMKGEYVNGMFAASAQTDYKYDAKGNLLVRDAPNARSEYTYDMYGNLQKVISYNKPSFDTFTRTYQYIFPGVPQLRMLTEEKLETNTYAWLSKYEYNSARQVVKLTALLPTGPGKFDSLYSVDSNVYSPTGDLVQAHKKNANGTGRYELYSYDGNHNVISHEIAIFPTATSNPDRYLTKYAYNKYNQPVEQRTYEFDYSTQTWVKLSGNYYSLFTYEEYVPTEVSQLAINNNAKFTLYPNPATNIMYISTTQRTTGVSRLAIYDTQGMLVRQWVEDLSAVNEHAIVTGNLPNGNYILQLVTDVGTVSKQFTVNR